MGIFSISPWKWPLPRDDKERLIVLHRLFIWLTTESAYRLFIRQHNFEVYGFVHRDSMLIQDQGYGRPMPWLHGIRFEGNEIKEWKEPRLRKQPVTGAPEETVHLDTGLMLITARNTGDWSDDDDNFTWVLSAREAESYHNKMQHINEQRAANSELNEQANNYRLMTDELAGLADVASRRSNRLNEKNSYLMKENGNLREQIAGQKAKVREMRQMVGYNEAKLTEEDKLAISRGHFDGKSSFDKVKDSVKDIQDLQLTVSQLVGSSTSNTRMSEESFKTLNDSYNSMREDVIKIMEETNKTQAMLAESFENAKKIEQQPEKPEAEK